MWTLPNILTLSRIALLPVLIALFYWPHPAAPWVALGIYTFCCITDFLDGYLARSMQSVSNMGKFLDPISDKIFVACIILTIAAFDRINGLWLIAGLVIFTREFLISGLREFLGPQNIQVPVSNLAKWKTTFQMIALGFLIVGHPGDVLVPHTLLIGQILLSIAAFITAWTGMDYLKHTFKHLK